MKKFLLASICCFLSFSANADALFPQNLFAKKSKDVNKEGVFSWTNSDKYTCDSPVTLFFETKSDAEEVLKQCLGKEGFVGGLVTNVKLNEEDYTFYFYGKKYDNPVYRRKNKEVIAFFPNEIKLCPENKPLLDNYGVCHSCDEPEPIDISWMVGTYFNPREFTGRVSYFCSTICPNRRINQHNRGNRDFCVIGSPMRRENFKKAPPGEVYFLGSF